MTSSVKFRTDRERANTANPLEEQVKFSRAVRVGDRVIVSGCPALGDDGQLDPALKGDVYGQSKVAFGTIDKVLKDLRSSLENVVKVRIYVTAAESAGDAVRAFTELFGETRPACTLVGVPFLLGEGLLVEIEAEAVD